VSRFQASAGLFGIVLVTACATARSPAAVSPSRATHGLCLRTGTPSCEGSPPTYARDIVPILQRRCFQCHAGDGVAADDHNFSRFVSFHAQRSSVADQVAACTMPPTSQPRLPQDEAEAILRWAACGGLE